jgi:hypothetical protein
LARALARYRDARGLTDGDLTRLPGCDAGTLVRLKLCSRADHEAGDLAAIAGGVGMDAEALARLLSMATPPPLRRGGRRRSP